MCRRFGNPSASQQATGPLPPLPEATYELGAMGCTPGRQDSSQKAGGKPQPALYAALPPDLPLALWHEYRAGNLGLPLVPFGLFTRLIHLGQRKFVGDERVEGEFITVPYQIVQQPGEQRRAIH